jgi:AraC family transcriptional regulator
MEQKGQGMSQERRPAERGDRLRLGYLYGSVALYQPGETLGPRDLSDYELVLITEGNVTYIADGRHYALAPGSVVLARPGSREEYVWDRTGRTKHAYFHFGITGLPCDWPEPDRWPVQRRDADGALATLFQHVLHRIAQHSGGPSREPSAAECRMVEALIEVFLKGPHPDVSSLERPEPVRRAVKWMRELIDEDPGRRVALADLAAAANVSQKHLCRVFARSIGHAPLETYRLLRLQLAVALLARSNLSIKEIAQRCGFDDALYFSRCFSHTLGCSPLHARNRMRKGSPPPALHLPMDVTPRIYW